MKKIAIFLTLALVLAFAAPVFANPFSDVPADHWAYDAISKLADDGIITGNPDGTYTGKKNMTRYEMATIVAKAMAATEANADKVSAEDKAAIDKLAAEFGAELNALGVKVAALEKKIGNVKFTGDARLRYRDDKVEVKGVEHKQISDEKDKDNGKLVKGETESKVAVRVRLVANAQVNDKVNVVARLETDNYRLDDSTNGNQNVDVDNFYVQYAGKKVTAIAGRQDVTLGKGTIFDDTLKGVAVVVPVAKTNVTMVHGYLDLAAANDGFNDVTIGNVKADDKLTLTAIDVAGLALTKKATLGFDYGQVKDRDTNNAFGTDDAISLYGVNMDYALGNNLGLFAEYAKSDIKVAGKDENQKAMMVGLNAKVLKNTNAKVTYGKIGANSIVPGFNSFDTHLSAAAAAAKVDGKAYDNLKLWNVRLDHALMANTNLYVDYSDVKADKDNTGKFTRLESGLEFKF